MKKLLLLGSIMIVGATAFAESVSAPVKIRAEIVADNLIISDINGRPILLDFGKISNVKETASNAEVEYKITSTSEVTEDMNLGIVLNSETPVLGHVNQAIDQSIETKIALDKKIGSIPTGGTEYRGVIKGTILGDDKGSLGKEVGMYEGQSELTVTKL